MISSSKVSSFSSPSWIFCRLFDSNSWSASDSAESLSRSWEPLLVYWPHLAESTGLGVGVSPEPQSNSLMAFIILFIEVSKAISSAFSLNTVKLLLPVAIPSKLSSSEISPSLRMLSSEVFSAINLCCSWRIKIPQLNALKGTLELNALVFHALSHVTLSNLDQWRSRTHSLRSLNDLLSVFPFPEASREHIRKSEPRNKQLCDKIQKTSETIAAWKFNCTYQLPYCCLLSWFLCRCWTDHFSSLVFTFLVSHQPSLTVVISWSPGLNWWFSLGKRTFVQVVIRQHFLRMLFNYSWGFLWGLGCFEFDIIWLADKSLWNK